MKTLHSHCIPSLLGACFLLALGAAMPAHAQLVDVSWSANSAFERPLTVAPAGFVDQDYCWMWENKGGVPAPITLHLQRK